MANLNSISQDQDVSSLVTGVYDTITMAHSNLEMLYTLFDQIGDDSSKDETLGIASLGEHLAFDLGDLLGGMREEVEVKISHFNAAHPDKLAAIMPALDDALAIAKEAGDHHNELKSMFACISKTWKKWPESSSQLTRDHRSKTIGNLRGIVDYRANQLMQAVNDHVEAVEALRA